MAEIVGGIGWILALVGWYLASDWKASARQEVNCRELAARDRDDWRDKFQSENLRASAAVTELNSLKEAIRERAKQPVIPVEHDRHIRKGSWADIRKANQAAILREQEISDKKDADTAFEE